MRFLRPNRVNMTAADFLQIVAGAVIGYVVSSLLKGCL